MNKRKREPTREPKIEGLKGVRMRMPSETVQSIVNDSVRKGCSEETFRTRVAQAAQVEIMAESVGKLQNPPTGDSKEHSSLITIQGQKFEVTAAQVAKPLRTKMGTIKIAVGDVILVEGPGAVNAVRFEAEQHSTAQAKIALVVGCDAKLVKEKNNAVKRAIKQFRLLKQAKRNQFLSALRAEYTPAEKNRTLAFNDSLPIFEAP